jgi:hypothetical protein
MFLCIVFKLAVQISAKIHLYLPICDCHIRININYIKLNNIIWQAARKANVHHSWQPIVTKQIVSIHLYARVNKIYNLKYIRLFKYIVQGA